MDYGFVTGLPRSGSAWLANYLSYGNCMFLHDAWKDKTPSELKAELGKNNAYAGGVVDPSNALYVDKIDKEFPDAKWVVITRPPAEVKKACENIDFPFADFTTSLKAILLKKNVLKVPFVEMFDRADEIGRFLYKDWECPAWRKKQLKGMNVQVHWGKVSDQFRVPANIKEMDVITPAKMEYFRLIEDIVGGDAAALEFLKQARDASELYRRLDQGLAIDKEKAKETLESLAIGWMISPFVRNFSASLSPSLAQCIEKYQHDKALTHCPVDTDLLGVVTFIFRGKDGVKEFMPKARELSDKILAERN